MAPKDTSKKLLTKKKSSEGLAKAAPAKKTETTVKSLKRKQEEATRDVAAKEPSPKKGKVAATSVKSAGKEKEKKTEKPAAKEATTSTKSAKPTETSAKSSAKAKTVAAAPAPAPSKTPKSTKPQQKPAGKAAAKKSEPKISHSRRKQRSPKPVASSDEEDAGSDEEDEDKEGEGSASEQEDSSDEEEEENIHLGGFSTDEDSSDDEDAMDEDSAKPFDVAKLPTVAKDDAIVKQKLEKAKKKPTGDRGVLFLGRIPHGFYEDEMKAYFSQFGQVTRLRISRNKKTGKSKHYGFIEFESSNVAKIVAETMDNYLMHGHLLQCKMIPKEEVHPQLWVGANRKWKTVPSVQVTRAKHNKKRDEETREVVAKRLVKRENQRKRKLQDLGISYDFDPVSYKKSKVAEKA